MQRVKFLATAFLQETWTPKRKHSLTQSSPYKICVPSHMITIKPLDRSWFGYYYIMAADEKTEPGYVSDDTLLSLMNNDTERAALIWKRGNGRLNNGCKMTSRLDSQVNQ